MKKKPTEKPNGEQTGRPYDAEAADDEALIGSPAFQQALAQYREATRPPPGLREALLAIPDLIPAGSASVIPMADHRPSAPRRTHGQHVGSRGPGGYRLPSWVRPGGVDGELVVHRAAASSSSSEPETFDVAVGETWSKVTLSLIPLIEGGRSRLRVQWEAAAYHPQGWELVFARADGEVLACVPLVSKRNKGDVNLGADDLGFDPNTTAWKYQFRSRS